MSNKLMVISEEAKGIMAAVAGDMDTAEKIANLDSIIDKIGNLETTMDAEARKQASKYIDEWGNIVCERIRNKVDKLDDVNRLLSIEPAFFNIEYDHNEGYHFITDGYIKNVLALFDNDNNELLNIYSKMVEMFDEFEVYRKIEKPIREFTTDDMSKNEIVIINMNNDMADRKFNIECNRRVNAIRKKYSELYKKMIKNSKYIDFIKELDKQINNLNEVKSVAREKEQLAKMNILIPDAEVRSILRELSAFQKTI